MQPETRYAKSGEINIGYQVVGEGPLDLVFIPGFVSHIDLYWADPAIARFLERLASFSRLILFDKRGTGVSDPVSRPAPLEERMDDVRAVMDAAGSERAAILGMSEGAPMGILFAATYPERATALVLAGGMVSGTALGEAPGFGDLIHDMRANLGNWGDGTSLQRLAPSAERRLLALFERAAASPAMAAALVEMNLQVDVTELLHSVRVPTLIVHRQDEIVPVEFAHQMADRIPGAKLVILPGTDHIPWFGDSDTYVEEIEEFLTGARHAAEPERALATVLFTDIVDSTRQAAELGDSSWRTLVAEHDRIVRGQLDRFRGREVKTLGDGFLATFDGPARGVRCAQGIVAGVQEAGLDVRAGLHTGECEVVGEDIGGMAVNIGARVGALAGPREVLVSSTVRDLVVGSGIEFADRGVAELKGVPGEWRLYRALDGAAPPSAAGRTRDERELRPSDRALMAAGRRAPGLTRAALGRYRRRRRRG